MLCHYYNVFPAFLHIAIDTRFKTSENEEDCAACFSRLHIAAEDSWMESCGEFLSSLKTRFLYSAEFTYSVRHIEEHNRSDLLDP